MGSRLKRVSSSVVPSFSRSADLVSGSVKKAFKAARGLPKPLLIGCGAVLSGIAVIIAMTIGGVTARAGQDNRSGVFPGGTGPFGGPGSSGTAGGTAAPAVTTGVFDGIILPDLLIVLPSGLQSSDVSGLRSIKGVRKMVTFDGAQVSISGRRANVIGVDPGRFRSWVPLRAASDNELWTRLASSGFIASASAAKRLGLSGG
ncbi:MAG TPA: hypothetical protein VHK04_03115, partial [Castellaniella sp.]|nr:hypothetical protein [Castellaniella sp.]